LPPIEAELEKLKRDASDSAPQPSRRGGMREVEAQHTTLTSERDDSVGAIKRLRQGIQSLNREARERLLALSTW